MAHLNQMAQRVADAVNAPPIHKIYANSLVSSHAQQRGSVLYPFRLMQDALDSIPAGTSADNADDNKHYVIESEPGVIYDEHLLVDLNRKNVRMISDSIFFIGDPIAAADNDVNRRNITVKTYDNWVNFRSPSFSLGYDNGIVATHHAPEVTGKVAFTGDNPQVIFHCHADIKGTTGDATGDSMDIVDGSVFANFYSSAIRGKIVGGTSGPSFGVHRADDTLFYGDMTLLRYNNWWRCDIRGDVTVGSAVGSRGLQNCKFPNAITWTGPAGSFVVDPLTNKLAKAAPVTLAGGATKVLNWDLVA